MAPAVQRYWQIVGGVNTDGIIVRSGKDMKSPQAVRRLSTGSIVLEKEVTDTCRLWYSLVSGNGPPEGWVSISSQGKELAKVCENPQESNIDPKCEDLRDPEYLDELETHEMTIGHLKAVVTRRPEGKPKAPFVVLMLPGNPIVNSYNASLPLPTAVDKAFAAAGFPVVRFDWDGVGMNRPGRREPSQDYGPAFEDSGVVYKYAIENLGESVILCAWNYSGTVASKIILQNWPGAAGLVSLSFGYKQWEFVARFAHPIAGEMLKNDFEEHSQIEIPSLYVFSSKDVHTPEDEVRRIVESRPDGGERAEICIIDQSNQKMLNTEYFMMKDREKEVGHKCASWLNKLRTDVRAAESLLAGA